MNHQPAERRKQSVSTPITLLPPQFVPMTSEQEAHVIAALAEILASYMERERAAGRWPPDQQNQRAA